MSTNIEWTDETWNPVTGCTKVSQGCKHCYAEREWGRLSANPKATAYYGRAFTDVRCHPERLSAPLRWTKPRKVFVNSMSDLFHEAVPFEFIAAVFGTMALAPQHTFQILTKRPQRMRDFFDWIRREAGSPGARPGEETVLCALRWRRAAVDTPASLKHVCLSRPVWPLPNVHLGVSIEDQPTADERIPLLFESPAALYWVSAEPLLVAPDISDWLTPEFSCSGFVQGQSMEDGYCGHCAGHATDPIHVGPQRAIGWVVAGGESGPRARATHPDEARSLRDQCAEAGVPFLWKQWGEWLAIDQGEGNWYRTLYHSNRAARPGEDQSVLDDLYGRHCVVPQLCLRAGGDHVDMRAPNAFLQGTRPVQAFRIGKKAAGRLLDGVLYDTYPDEVHRA